MSEARLSVVIPTYNRKEILRRTLRAYRSQSPQREIVEILVVDDGSTDGTDSTVAECSEGSVVIPIRYLRQEKKGLAAARNFGIREARGDLVLFGDDDIIPGPDLVAEHLAWHKKYPDPSVSVLGHVTWSPGAHPTPFMEWLGMDGVLFGFRRLAPEKEADFRFFYFCNTSVKIEFLRKNGTFDEDFRAYGFEDIELGYRLQKKGARVLYNPKAVGYHYKQMSFADACRRAEQVALARRVFETKEAGVYLADLERKERSKPGGEVRKFLVRWFVPVLTPLRPLLDSRIRLPKRVYAAFYNYQAFRIERRLSRTSGT